MKPGDTLVVTLSNTLPAELFDTASLHNEFRDFDVTNLHTHGLHIGSVAPADDIFLEVGPGQSYTYTYNIPSDHMGGTFWYHPHHHGSTNMHAGGGAAGALIVEDPPGSLPAEMEALEEVLLFMHHWDMPALQGVAQEYIQNCRVRGAGRCRTCGCWCALLMGRRAACC